MRVGGQWWRDRRVLLVTAGVALAAGGLSAGAYVLREAPRRCGGPPVRVMVAAAPQIAAAIGEVAARFNVEPHEVAGRCVRVAVAAREPGVVARSLARRDARGVDAWLPDSSIWLWQAGVRPAGPPVATTPVVIAAPRAVAADLGRSGRTWRVLARRPRHSVVRALAPDTNAAGALTTLVAGRSANVPRVPDLGRLYAALAGGPGERPVVAASEQSVVAYNDAHRPGPAAVLIPVEGTMLLDHPFVPVTTDFVRAQAVDAFRAALRSGRALATLERHGFRGPDATFDAAYARRLDLPARLPRVLPLPGPARVAAAMRG